MKKNNMNRITAAAVALLLLGVGMDRVQAKVSQQDLKHRALVSHESQESNQELSKKIQKAIDEDKSLSGHEQSEHGNDIKATARNGAIILTGHVASVEERKHVFDKAARIAGRTKIDNELATSNEKATLP